MDVGTLDWMVCLLGTSSTAGPIFLPISRSSYNGVYPHRIQVETKVMGLLDPPSFDVVGDTLCKAL